MRFHQPRSDIIPCIRLDRRIGSDNTVRRQLFQKIIHLRVLNHLRYPLRMHAKRAKQEQKEYVT